MKSCFAFFSFIFGSYSYSQNTRADKLIAETQYVRQIENNMKLVWWIPTEYWELALENNKSSATEEQINYLRELLDDYMIIVAGDYSLTSQNGEMSFNVNSNIKENMALYGPQGGKLKALKNGEIDERVVVIVNETLKPLFAQMLGKMGGGAEFFIYNNMKDGTRIIDPTKAGSFHVELGKENFSWKLPLVSLMKEKICPVDQETMEGNWIYCPIHGQKL